MILLCFHRCTPDLPVTLVIVLSPPCLADVDGTGIRNEVLALENDVQQLKNMLQSEHSIEITGTQLIELQQRSEELVVRLQNIG